MKSPQQIVDPSPERQPIRRVGLIARSWDALVGETSDRLHTFFASRDVNVHVDESGPIATLHGAHTGTREDMGEACDLLVAIGGDGTMLDAANLASRCNKPLVGINRGRLGFLADISPEDTGPALSEILAGRYIHESRLMLRATLTRQDGSTEHALALNDIVIQKYDVGRMLEVQVHMDGTYVNRHRGDGLIITTPTGSTAYALSGGGPIMAPGLDALAMVPICPHTLSDRPVVVPASSNLNMHIDEPSGGRAQIMTDGQPLGDMHAGDTLNVMQAAERVTLLHPMDYDYFRILRSKLAWGRAEPDPRN
ncbi:MAG: NAD(+) kinase [Gammaproteobacteria bacterium]